MKTLFTSLLLFIFLPFGICQEKLFEGSMNQAFYTANHQQLFWFSSFKNTRKANEWLKVIEASDKLGLNPNKALIRKVQSNMYSPKLFLKDFKNQVDTQITTIVLDFLKTFQEGNSSFSYNEISKSNDSVFVMQLLHFSPNETVSSIVSRLDCRDHDYLILKKFLKDSIKTSTNARIKSVMIAMNYRRFLTINHQSDYIVVNIPSLFLEYYRNDTLILRMKTVVGRRDKQTPTIASYITSIVTFPHWNVPYTIAVKEILPKIQVNENYLEKNNMEVVDANGNSIDASTLIWKSYGEQNFPYYFRQSTGADNALGIFKFNLQNPFSIYLHATNWQGSFDNEDRFLSHGCIRLEKPFELANYLLNKSLDFVKTKENEENVPSKTWMLPQKIPTYLIYSPAMVVGESVIFLPDYYKITYPKSQIPNPNR